MPHVARPPSGRPGLDDSALITFHEVDAQYPVMSSTNLAALMSPFAPVPAAVQVNESQPTELESAA
jgi:hypothetical protein